MTNSLWWYVARAGGLVSWALLAAAVLWGLALRSRILGSRPRPAWLLDLHRYLAAIAVIFVGVHVGAILLDGYVHFDLVQVLIPFTSTWHPVAVAWGIVAAYLLLAVELTSLARAHLSRTLWRRVHYLELPALRLRDDPRAQRGHRPRHLRLPDRGVVGVRARGPAHCAAGPAGRTRPAHGRGPTARRPDRVRGRSVSRRAPTRGPAAVRAASSGDRTAPGDASHAGRHPRRRPAAAAAGAGAALGLAAGVEDQDGPGRRTTGPFPAHAVVAVRGIQTVAGADRVPVQGSRIASFGSAPTRQ